MSAADEPRVAALEHLEVQDVTRVALRPGDVIVLRTRRRASYEVCVRLMDQCRLIWPDNKVVVLDPDYDLEVVGPETIVLETISGERWTVDAYPAKGGQA